MSIKYKL